MVELDDNFIRKNFVDKEILVTGGCGFIGSHLAEQLLKFGAKVTVFDPYIWEISPEINTVKGDIRDSSALDKAMEGKDMVFHLAALLGVEKILDIPLETLEVNLGGTINALECARKNDVSRFIFSSSSEVYGEPQKIPISEDDPRAPVSVYGVTKLASETYCEAYMKKYGLETTRVRYFNVYGPRQTEKFVMSLFVSRVAKNKPPIVYGDGNQLRSYTYIDDAIKGTISAAVLDDAVGDVFNIGNDKPTTINELADLVIQYFGENLKPEFKNFGDGIRLEKREIKQRMPDISKAKKILGYGPKVSLREGVERYIKWYTESRMTGH